MPTHVAEIDKSVDASQQVIRRHVIVDREFVEQRALPRPHHCLLSPASGEVNQQPKDHSSGVFQHNQPDPALCGA